LQQAYKNGKRPDRLTPIPWQGGKPLVWDVTVVSTLAQSYVDRAATGVGAVEERAAERKAEKYHNLLSDYIPANRYGEFIPCGIVIL